VVCYRASDHGFFGEHLDLAVRFSTRKVSVTVQLSAPDDYDGGDLLVGGTEHPGGRPRGAVTVFPAWRTHGVAPVRRGERLAIVGWVHGPAFR
jgi:PKHD-type hydroxylase